MKKQIIHLLVIPFSIMVHYTTMCAQDGTIDMSFGTNGTVVTVSLQEAFDMAIQQDDKIIVVGSSASSGSDFAIARYDVNGNLDNSFGTGGIVLVDFNGGNDDASAVEIQADGKIVVVGRAQQSNANSNSDLAVIRLNTNGTLDNSFGTNGKFQLDVDGYAFDYLLDVKIQSDGKIVALGAAGTNMFNKNAIIRLNSNGTLDNSFDGDGILKAFSFPGGVMSSLYGLAIQPDGKIIVTGGTPYFAAARLNSNGSLDNSFGSSGGYSNGDMATGSRVVLQSDGKIVITYYTATQSAAVLLRLNSNGTIDNTFGTNGKATTSIPPNQYTNTKDVFYQSNGKILSVGSHYTNGSTSDFLLIRHNSNGTLDNTFGPSNTGYVTTSVASTDEDRGAAVGIQSSGKIVVAGSKCTGSCDFVLIRYNNTAIGISEQNNSVSFNLYPNPVNDVLYISQLKNKAEIKIYDITGRIIFSEKANTDEISINTKHFTDGTYFITIKDDNNLHTQKFIVHHN